MKRSNHFLRIRSMIFGLMSFGILFFHSAVHAQVHREKVSVKAHYYLVRTDTIIYAATDTVIFLPEGTKYKTKKDISLFLQYPFHGHLLKLFYRPESETTPVMDTVMHVKSESPFTAYENKIIRNIIIYPIGVNDPGLPFFLRKNKNVIDSAAEVIHINTREQVIKNSLFFQVGDSVIPNVLADNERYLRSLPFLQDALIMIDQVKSSNDSVDVIIATKDVWSIGLGANAVVKNQHTSRMNSNLYDGNFLGYGQRVDLNMNYDTQQKPRFGGGATYTKYNLLGSFVDLNAGCSTINGGPHLGGENESSIYFQLNRSFYRPTSRYSGGLTASINRSNNTFEKPPTDFLNYSYLLTDAWSAYTLIHYKNKVQELKSRDGHYLSGRFFRQSFFDKPIQPAALKSPTYNDQWYVLGSLNFFRQNFYKTRYISEFGKTEDIPYGHFFSVYVGTQYTSFRYRLYSGAEYEREYVFSDGSFARIQFLAGGFFHKNDLEDFILRYDGYWYSKVLFFQTFKIRQMFSSTYAIALHPVLVGPLNVNGSNGIDGFSSNYPSGLQRIVVHSETSCWAPYIVYGFRFVFFASEEIAAIGPNNGFLTDNKLYCGFGGGVRIKNENLIFKSFELKMFYYPNIPPDGTKFRIGISTSLGVSFSQPLIHAPSFISME